MSTTTREDGRWVEVHPGKHVLVEFDPDRTFHCVDECTWCCHHGVLLYEPDIFALAEHASLGEATTEARGNRFIKQTEKSQDAPAGADGKACHFLDGEGMCSLHAAHDWKPSRCSVFPLEIEVRDGTFVVDVREDAETHCEGLDVSERRLIDHLDAFLPPVLWEIDDPTTAIEL